MCADGKYMPPMFIFPRKRMKPELMDGAMSGAWATCHPSGWMQSDLFVEWMKKFIIFSHASLNSKVLLLLDGHSTHTMNIDVIDLAKNNGVIMLCFPPHCTHRLQPLDVSFMKPLSTYYAQMVKQWLRSNPGRVVSAFQIAKLVSEAFLQAATMRTAINGFKTTGIWPVNENVFDEADYAPSTTTDIIPSTITTPSVTTPLEDLPSNNLVLNAEPNMDNAASITDTTSNLDLSFAQSICDVMPIPKVKQTTIRKKRKRGSTSILTSSPYLSKLKLQTPNKEKQPKKGKHCKKSLKYKKAANNVKVDQEEDAACLFCEELYSTSTEGWICCCICHRWAHYSCAGVDECERCIRYICDLCQ
uniref:Nucleosome-remodeling factor subunit NURF301 n=1 Tax=Phallusia mammillata TaxID=59560 RepID=A0A6F9DQ28_9ASCI|nr:nucleosome-remodeling factor subunit NURF301 [Phallusia mammillata]